MQYLYRSKNKKIFGVCAGIGECFGIDPTIIRLLWIGLVIGCGTGILTYIIFAITIPMEQ